MEMEFHAENTCLLNQQLDRITASAIFARAVRSQRFLRYLVVAAAADPSCTVKEYTIATEVFDRSPQYDPSIDATVRVEAGRLRSRLREYYSGEGLNDLLLIELPKGGYRIVLTTRTLPETFVQQPFSPAPADILPRPIPAVADPSTAWRLPRLSSRLSGRYALPLLLSAITLALVPGWSAWKTLRSRSHPPDIHSIAVLPLRNLSGDPGQDYFSDATTDTLITELAEVPNLRVASWNSVLTEKKVTRPLSAIARDLGADALVEGSVVRSGNTVRINVQLIDPRTGMHLWAGSFEGQAGALIALEDQAAQAIADHTHGGQDPASSLRPSSPSLGVIPPSARQAYLHGRNYFDKRESRASADEFQRAIDLDPTYAAAYAGLSVALESQALLGQAAPDQVIPRAIAAAEQSLKLDPGNGDALIARGSIAVNFTWDWNLARQDLTRGILLSPENSFGRMMLSLYLDAVGQPDQAVREMQTAVEIDPLSFLMARHYGSTLFYARRYDEALTQLLYARKMHPESSPAVNRWIRDVYEKQGKYGQAIEYDLLDVGDHRGADRRKLLSVYRLHGWQAYWALRESSLQGQPGSCSSYDAGLAALRSGQRETAVFLFADAVRKHCFWMNLARTDPQLDGLRGVPGFDAVVAGLHLPPQSNP